MTKTTVITLAMPSQPLAPSPYTLPPKLITFEGGEGAGKSTQVKLLAAAFEKSGHKSALTREPGGTEGAEAIRNLLVNGDSAKWDATTELLLHLTARHDHITKFIRPQLAQGSHVICDRFTDSTIAYQAYGHGLGINYVSQFCNLVLGNFQPDLTIILDIETQNGISRAGARGIAENRYEKMGLDFHENVRHGFLEIAKSNPQRCVVINAEDDIDSIHRQIVAEVALRLGLNLK